MATSLQAPPLTQLEFQPADHAIAERIARAMGYEQYAYTSTSGLWGLFCLPENPARATGRKTQHACIIKTKEHGFLVVQLAEDLGLDAKGRPTR